MQRPLRLPPRRTIPAVKPSEPASEESTQKVTKPLTQGRGSRLPATETKSAPKTLKLQSFDGQPTLNVEKIALVKVDSRNLQIEVFREIEDPRTGEARKGWTTYRGGYYRWSKHLIEELLHIVTPEDKCTLDEMLATMKALKRELELAVKGQSEFLVFVSKGKESDDDA